MVKKVGKSRDFYRIFLCYFTLMVVLVAFIGSTFFIGIRSRMYNEIGNMNIEMMNLLSRSVEQLIIKKLNDSITCITIKNTYLDRFLDMKTEEEMANARELIWDMEKIKEQYGFVESIYIYKKDENAIISTDGYTLLDDNADVDKAVTCIYDTSWLKGLRKEKQSHLWLGSHTIKGNSLREYAGSSVITYVTCFPFNSGYRDNVVLAANLFEEDFLNIIKGFNPDIFSNIAILDRSGNVLTASSKLIDYFNRSNFSGIPGGGGSSYYTDEMSGQVYFVSYITSGFNDWRFVSIIPYGAVFKSLEVIKGFVIIISGIALIAGMFLSLFMAVRQYSPLRMITELVMRTFPGNSSTSAERNGEYGIIRETVISAGNHLRDMEKEYKENSSLVVDSLFRILFTDDRAGYIQIINKLEKHGVYLQNGSKRIVVVHFGSTPNEMKNSRGNEISRYLPQLIHEGFDCNGINDITSFRLDKETMGIVMNNEGCIKDRHRISRLFASMLDEISGVYTTQIIIGVSSSGKNISSLPALYTEALEAVKMRHYNEGPVFLFEDIKKMDSSVAGSVDGMVKGLLKSINLGNPGECKKAVEGIFMPLVNKMYAYAQVRQVLLDAASVIVLHIREERKLLRMNTDERDIASKLYEYDIHSFREWLFAVILDLVQRKKEIKEKKSNDIVEKSMKYINENIYNDITVETLADKLALNPFYVRQIFKEITGTSLSGHIFGKKMEEARKLLLTTEKSIEKISKELHFSASHYFIKKFKESHGMTPKEFRVHKRLEEL